MNRRLIVTVVVLLCAIGTASASQFVRLPFDQVAREATLVVRGTLGPITSAWDDSHEVIYSTALLRVNRYFDGVGPQTLLVREVGGTVGNYTQEAIGFPALREGEEVVLFLSRWDDNPDWRIAAYNQGKYLVRNYQGIETLVPDRVQQGTDRTAARDRMDADGLDTGLPIDEFAEMVRSARRAMNRPASARE